MDQINATGKEGVRRPELGMLFEEAKARGTWESGAEDHWSDPLRTRNPGPQETAATRRKNKVEKMLIEASLEARREKEKMERQIEELQTMVNFRTVMEQKRMEEDRVTIRKLQEEKSKLKEAMKNKDELIRGQMKERELMKKKLGENGTRATPVARENTRRAAPPRGNGSRPGTQQVNQGRPEVDNVTPLWDVDTTVGRRIAESLGVRRSPEGWIIEGQDDYSTTYRW